MQLKEAITSIVNILEKKILIVLVLSRQYSSEETAIVTCVYYIFMVTYYHFQDYVMVIYLRIHKYVKSEPHSVYLRI